MKIQWIDLEKHGDERGNLITIESMKNIPFEIKRIYYIYGTKPSIRRGCHAHHNLKQLLFCVKGSCKIDLNDGETVETVELNDCSKALYLDVPLWREMYDFSEDAVLLCVASDYYDEEDYIRDYDEWLNFSHKQED